MVTNPQHNDLTVREKLLQIIKKCKQIEDSSERQDSRGFQASVHDALQQLNTLRNIVTSLSLFSENERLNEINTSYLPFAALPYYESILLQKLLINDSGSLPVVGPERLNIKLTNLRTAKIKVMEYLAQIESFRGVLSPRQNTILDSFTNSHDPSHEEILASNGDPTSKRASKIANFKLEKELSTKLASLDDYDNKNSKGTHDHLEEDISEVIDEDRLRSLYVDRLRLFSIHAFRDLELITTELKMLGSERSNRDTGIERFDQSMMKSPVSKFDYTPRLESDPTKHRNISELISKSGKILQPFVITGNKQKLRREVFGTGQTLPSMSVEEYLDFELANGKMLKSDSKTSYKDGSDESTDNSDDELEKRIWDDWKDLNPKGSGNMKANIG